MANKTNNNRKKEVKKEGTMKGTSTKAKNNVKSSSKNKSKKEVNQKSAKKTNNEVEHTNGRVNNKTQKPKNQNNKKIEKKELVQETIPNEDVNMADVIKMTIVVVVAFLLFYSLTIGIQKWQKNKNNKNLNIETNKIQYDEILISKVLKQSPDNYYVLVINDNDENKASYTSYINKLQETKAYTANLNSAFNRDFYAEESNLVVEDISSLKIKDTTLLHIENHTISEGIEGSSAVLDKLMTLN